MLSTLVKISNVTNLSDARYCSGMGVEWIGFSVDEGDVNYVSPKKFGEIKSWLAGVKVMAETKATDLAAILDMLDTYEVDGVQIPDTVQAGELKAVSGKTVFVRIDTDELEPADLPSVLAGNPAEMYVLESHSENELDHDWQEVITYVARTHEILIGFGIENPEIIENLVNTMAVAGIALKGSEEIRPGFKDFGSLMDILEALEDEG